MQQIELQGTSFIGFTRGGRGDTAFRAANPATGGEMEPDFFAASDPEVEKAAHLADAAATPFGRTDGKKRAALLRRMADNIEEVGEVLIERCCAETGLPVARIEGERARTCNQLRLFAQLVEEGSWVNARIDRADADRKPLPKPDIRYLLRPLGPVLVFGASNFPLAFSAGGGDVASALAAGCPVIVKAHHSHPGTNELVAGAIRRAVEAEDLPQGVYSLLFGSGRKVGVALVRHPAIQAVGFTGSFQGGMSLWREARNRKDPIPVFAEMGSVNPVFVLEGALSERSEELANGLVNSVTLGVGQFCTNPGLVIVQDTPAARQFIERLRGRFAAADPGVMLNKGIYQAYHQGVSERASRNGVAAELLAEPGEEPGTRAAPALFTVKGSDFLAERSLHEEIFGPCTQVVLAADESALRTIAKALDGQLTASVHGSRDDLDGASDLVQILERKAGRLVFNGFPTGLEVCHSTMHGGPFPATTDPRFTSVGTSAIFRFARPVAFQDCPQDLLPAELQDSNPLGIWRLIDGEFQR